LHYARALFGASDGGIISVSDTVGSPLPRLSPHLDAVYRCAAPSACCLVHQTALSSFLFPRFSLHEPLCYYNTVINLVLNASRSSPLYRHILRAQHSFGFSAVLPISMYAYGRRGATRRSALISVFISSRVLGSCLHHASSEFCVWCEHRVPRALPACPDVLQRISFCVCWCGGAHARSHHSVATPRCLDVPRRAAVSPLVHAVRVAGCPGWFRWLPCWFDDRLVPAPTGMDVSWDIILPGQHWALSPRTHWDVGVTFHTTTHARSATAHGWL